MTSQIEADAELLDVLGEDGLFDLAEAFGGTRLYVPPHIPSDHPIIAAIGHDRAEALSIRFSPDYIRVPLARRIRAVRHRAAGLSNARIAVRLGMTETGVNRLFKRQGETENA